MATKLYRVLILSASAGSGHLKAAEALQRVCETHPAIGEVVHLDALTLTNKLFRDAYSKLYIRMIRSTPTLLGWWYDQLDEPWKTARMNFLLNRLNTVPLVRRIREMNPDITICTHFLPAEIISNLINRGKIRTRLSIVVTDFDVHAMWLSRVFHHYFVAIEEARVHLKMLGLPENRITVSGIPILPVFGRKHDRKAWAAKHRIRPDLPMILVSAGAAGVGSAAHVARVLTKLNTPAQIVLVCGANEKLRREVVEVVNAHPAPHLDFRVLGYTNEMHEWMALASLFVGKPGGLTTAEAMACGLPMLIFQPVPGQEERNSDHLLEQGAAVRCNQITTMAYKIDALLQNPARLRRMSAAARRLGRPNAAMDVIETLLAQFRFAPIRLTKEKQNQMADAVRV